MRQKFIHHPHLTTQNLMISVGTCDLEDMQNLLDQTDNKMKWLAPPILDFEKTQEEESRDPARHQSMEKAN